MLLYSEVISIKVMVDQIRTELTAALIHQTRCEFIH